MKKTNNSILGTLTSILHRLHLDRYGFLLAILGLIPIRSGILLLQNKDCGCFLIEDAILHSHNILFGTISLSFGVIFSLVGILFFDWSNQKKNSLISILFLLSGLFVGYSMVTQEEVYEPDDGQYEKLAMELTSDGWILFYANWCPTCHNQIEIFGSSVKHLRMIDCDTITCPEFVKVYPTWALIKQDQVVEVREGFQSVEVLQNLDS